MTDEEMIDSAKKQAAEFRAIFDVKNKFREFYRIHLGWAILGVKKMPDKYDICPCGSEEKLKYKFCCWPNRHLLK